MMDVRFDYVVDIAKAYEDGGRWIVEGFAATSDFDLQEDVISQQAIEGSAKDLIENSTVLHNHNTNLEIGRVLESGARKGGLFLKILVSKTVPDIWQKIKEGVLNKFSVRGLILEAKKQWMAALKRYARLILKMRLVEVSLVAVPANPKARAIRWYIEKALDDFEARGGEIGGLEGGTVMAGENREDVELILEASGESEGRGEQETGNPPGGMEKAEGSLKEVADLAARLLAAEQDEARKKVLAQIRNLANGSAAKAEEEEGAGGEEALEKAGKKIAASRLNRLKKLLEELQGFIREVEPGETAKGAAEPDETHKRLEEIQGTVKRIADLLGLPEEPDEGREKAEPLVKAVDGLVKRLDALEGKAGARASLDGQEELAGSGQGDRSVWKGLL